MKMYVLVSGVQGTNSGSIVEGRPELQLSPLFLFLSTHPELALGLCDLYADDATKANNWERLSEQPLTFDRFHIKRINPSQDPHSQNVHFFLGDLNISRKKG